MFERVPPQKRTLAVYGMIGFLLLWAYWPTLEDLVRRWSTEPMYSHGYLVPGFALVLLWLRRDRLQGQKLAPSAWGLGFALIALIMRLGAGYFAVSSIDRYSLIPALLGLCCGLGGWPALRWAWPGIAFLVFMLPLPAGMDQFLAEPLQRLATIASAHVLQTLGFIAEAEGNVIVMSDSELGIVEACSGLRMFITFCALTTAVAVVIKGSLLRKTIIVASAFPLAVICNIARIAATGVVQHTLGSQAAQVVFHDVAGWLMIVMAMVLLGCELKLLAYLFIAAETEAPGGQLGKTLANYGFPKAGVKPPNSELKSKHKPARLAKAK